jgi:hypothetical protein
MRAKLDRSDFWVFPSLSAAELRAGHHVLDEVGALNQREFGAPLDVVPTRSRPMLAALASRLRG